MGVSGQRHAPAALYPRGKNPGTHWTRGCWAPEPVWTQRLEEKSSLPLPGIEPGSPGRKVCSQTLYCLSYPGSWTWNLTFGLFWSLSHVIGWLEFDSLHGHWDVSLHCTLSRKFSVDSGGVTIFLPSISPYTFMNGEADAVPLPLAPPFPFRVSAWRYLQEQSVWRSPSVV
jgi:hypothetical protein